MRTRLGYPAPSVFIGGVISYETGIVTTEIAVVAPTEAEAGTSTLTLTEAGTSTLTLVEAGTSTVTLTEAGVSTLL